MSHQPLGYSDQAPQYPGDDWQRQMYPQSYQSSRSGGIPMWAMVGLAAVAVGAWAVYSFGPDFRRYMKIRSM